MLCIHRSRMMDMIVDFQGIVEIPPPDLFLINQLLRIVDCGMHLESLLQHGYSLLADCLIYFIIDCIINVEHIFHVIDNGWNLLEFSRFLAINRKLNVSLCIWEGYILNLRKDNSLFLFPVDEGISMLVVLDEIICVPRHFIDCGCKFILISEL